MKIENGVLYYVADTDIVDGVVKIPEGVTKIGDLAFSNSGGRFTNLRKVILPNGITEIGKEAFKECINLQEINIPEGVTKIGSEAFRECKSLKSIVFPEGITELSYGIFNKCLSLEEFVIPESVTTISDCAFLKCKNLKILNISKNVILIEHTDWIFRGCENLILNVEANDNDLWIDNRYGYLQNMGEEPYGKYYSYWEYRGFPIEGITSSWGREKTSAIVIVNGNIRYVNKNLSGIFRLSKEIKSFKNKDGDNYFTRCDNAIIIQGNKLIYVGNNTIKEGKFETPEGVTEIGKEAFRECTGLTEITISEGVTTIGNGAFQECTSLVKIIVPESWNDLYNLSLNESEELVLKIQDEIAQDTWIHGNIKEIYKFISKIKFGENGKTIDNIFRYSKDYNPEYGISYILKMRDIFGEDGVEQLLRMPEDITEEELAQDQEELGKIYQTKYTINSNLPQVITVLEGLDTYLLKGSKDVKKDRIKLYTSLNRLLEENESLSFEELVQQLAEIIGIELDAQVTRKFLKDVQIKEYNQKQKIIEEKVSNMMSRPEYSEVVHGASGRVYDLIMNVIRNNFLKDGSIEEIDKVLEKEMSRTGKNGQLVYGGAIPNYKEQIKEMIKKIYAENEELLSKNLFEELKDGKEKIGNRWIAKLLQSKKGIKDIWSMTEEEKNKFETSLRENGVEISIEYSKKFIKRENVTDEEMYTVLDKTKSKKLLTYEKAELMFSSMRPPYSKKFVEWFMEHKEEIMENPEYYSHIANLHNGFDKILENRRTKQVFDNGKLSVDGAFNLLNELGNGLKGELGRLATEYGITDEYELNIIREIFETTKQREKSYIPQVKSQGNRYRGRILRADDPLNILAGNATNCCQRAGGVGQGSMEHGAKENNGRIFIVEELDENGEPLRIVAQSWVWRVDDRVCFDNIEVPTTIELSKDEQEEILGIYKECATGILEKDKKMFDLMLKKRKITKAQYDELVLKDVTVGTGNNDLYILENGELEEAKEIFYPDRVYDNMWIDSGGDDGTQLVLANSGIKRIPRNERKAKLEDLPLLYQNTREVKILKGEEIDSETIEQIAYIESIAYRDEQKMMDIDYIYDYYSLAEQYDLDPDNIEIQISREKDWYMIYEEKEDEIYIADLAMLNGVNSQNRGQVETDFMSSTLEMTEQISILMLEAAQKGKRIRMNATGDTSYKMVETAKKLGLIDVEEDLTRKWSEDSDIEMHDIILIVDKEKTEKELKGIREMRKKREERVELPKEFDEK